MVAVNSQSHPTACPSFSFTQEEEEEYAVLEGDDGPPTQPTLPIFGSAVDEAPQEETAPDEDELEEGGAEDFADEDDEGDEYQYWC